MGAITGERRSSQASATCAGVPPWLRAISASRPVAEASAPNPSGNQGRNAIPACSHASSTRSE